MKRAFGILQAIMIILVMSSIAVLTLKYATIQSKQFSDTLIKEQATLFLDSVEQATLLVISGYDRNATNKCLDKINITSDDEKFEANVTIERYFLYKDNSSCNDAYSIDTKELNGTAIVDIVVQNKNISPKTKDKNIRLIRRIVKRL